MDLIQAAWMIRDLGQPVSALDLEEDSVIAGGWDGALRKWNGDGDLIWKAQCSDRIESILRIEDLVVVTSGLHISCLKDGEIIWSEALEGSADLLAFHNGEIVATSSVYDIEHGDFMESAIWRFSLKGDLLNVERMDERPWFLDSNNKLLLGLGRPKCGILIDGEHQNLPTDSPVTCGLYGRENVLFGHANGVITSLNGKIISEESSSIESITCVKKGFVAALESGELVAKTPDSISIWKASGSQVTTQVSGFDDMHWCGRWGSSNGELEVRDSQGELIVTAKTTRPRVSDYSENRIGFGFEDGQILVWEKGLFSRRINQENVEENSRKSTLAAKLRSLRN
tara:strand:- start:172 stop:1194 length:1023 start_codon:yes stop_codon:yes gene_type:complete